MFFVSTDCTALVKKSWTSCNPTQTQKQRTRIGICRSRRDDTGWWNSLAEEPAEKRLLLGGGGEEFWGRAGRGSGRGWSESKWPANEVCFGEHAREADHFPNRKRGGGCMLSTHNKTQIFLLGTISPATTHLRPSLTSLSPKTQPYLHLLTYPNLTPSSIYIKKWRVLKIVV